MESIANIVSSLGSDNPKIRKAAQDARLLSVWDRQVKEPLRSNCRPLYLKGQVLFLEVASTVWAAQVKLLSTQICALLQQYLPELNISRLHTALKEQTAILPRNTHVQRISEPHEQIIAMDQELQDLCKQAGFEPLRRIVIKDQQYKQQHLRQSCSICGRKSTESICISCIIKQKETRVNRINLLIKQRPWASWVDCQKCLLQCSREEFMHAKENTLAKLKDQINFEIFINLVTRSDLRLRRQLQELVLRYASIKMEIPPEKITREQIEGILGRRRFKLYNERISTKE